MASVQKTDNQKFSNVSYWDNSARPEFEHFPDDLEKRIKTPRNRLIALVAKIPRTKMGR